MGERPTVGRENADLKRQPDHGDTSLLAQFTYSVRNINIITKYTKTHNFT